MTTELQLWLREVNPKPKKPKPQKIVRDQQQQDVRDEVPYRVLWVKVIREALRNFIFDNAENRRPEYWQMWLTSKDFQLVCDLAGINSDTAFNAFQRCKTEPREMLSLLGHNFYRVLPEDESE